MTPKKRYNLRVNPKRTNHVEYKKLYARWKKRNYLNDVEIFHTEDYTQETFINPILLASTGNLSIINACTYYRQSGIKCPSAELVLLRCREVPSDKMETHVNHALEKQFSDLPGKIRRDYRKRGIVIIDFHRDPYYGKADNPHVTSGAVKHSTRLAYSYLTADLYSPKGKQTIAVVHRPRGESIENLFWDLYTRIEFFLRPKLLLMDGEFSIVKILHELDQQGVKYVARKSISPRLKFLALAYTLTDDWESLRKFHAITLLDKTKKFETTVHVTFQREHHTIKALVVSPWLSLTPEEAEQQYDLRFSIDSGYRDKHAFQARTSSDHLSVRLIIFLFAIMLWNLWQAFLVLVARRSTRAISFLMRWRRQLRTIRLFLLRDELL